MRSSQTLVISFIIVCIKHMGRSFSRMCSLPSSFGRSATRVSFISRGMAPPVNTALTACNNALCMPWGAARHISYVNPSGPAPESAGRLCSRAVKSLSLMAPPITWFSRTTPCENMSGNLLGQALHSASKGSSKRCRHVLHTKVILRSPPSMLDSGNRCRPQQPGHTLVDDRPFVAKKNSSWATASYRSSSSSVGDWIKPHVQPAGIAPTS